MTTGITITINWKQSSFLFMVNIITSFYYRYDACADSGVSIPVHIWF